MDAQPTAYDELYAYTMERPRFILQHVVDAHRAQPMALFFALAGLLLHVERGFSGHEVQRVHMLLAKHPRQYPRITLPEHRGLIGPADVLAVAAGDERDAAIERWCQSVWEAFGESRGTIAAFLQSCNIG